MLVSVDRLHHRVTVSLCVHRAVGCAVPGDDLRLGLQRRAHRDGIGGVGREVQQNLGRGGRVADCGLGGDVGRGAGRGVRRGESRRVRRWHFWRRGGVGCCVQGQVGRSEGGWVGQCVWKGLRRRVCGWGGQSRPGCVCRGRLPWVGAHRLSLSHIPHLIVSVEQLQGTKHTHTRKESERWKQLKLMMCVFFL